jgi:hypothetical protein
MPASGSKSGMLHPEIHNYTNSQWRKHAQRLHERWLPLLRRLQTAEWQPVRGIFGTHQVWSERFGDPRRGPVYVTLLHEGLNVLTLDLRADLTVFPKGIARVRDLLHPEDRLDVTRARFHVPLSPGQLRVLEISSTP